ncbi:MAG: protease modulator HflC [Holosporales bacterium]|jgi:membrane protease subunit HflC|nr:protease modulator HflC [Holosporales bacterium]
MRKSVLLSLAGGIVLFLLATSSFFCVHQIEQALIVRFGEPVKAVSEPGLHFKMPFIDEATFFDKRLLDVDLSALEITLGDRRRVVVDAFCCYKITNPLLFFQTVHDVEGAHRRLTTTILGKLRSVLGNLSLSTLLSEQRSHVMKQIRDDVNQAASKFGLDVVDVRIRRTDLPTQNSEAIFNRMISEREREAKELRAKGIEMAEVVRSKVNRECAIMTAEAEQKAQTLRGEGDAEASRIYAEAFGQDPDFFSLYWSLEAYKRAFNKETTTFLVSPKGQFFRYFNRSKGEK